MHLEVQFYATTIFVMLRLWPRRLSLRAPLGSVSLYMIIHNAFFTQKYARSTTVLIYIHQTYNMIIILAKKFHYIGLFS